jgi:hypothetical protein
MKTQHFPAAQFPLPVAAYSMTSGQFMLKAELYPLLPDHSRTVPICWVVLNQRRAVRHGLRHLRPAQTEGTEPSLPRVEPHYASLAWLWATQKADPCITPASPCREPTQKAAACSLDWGDYDNHRMLRGTSCQHSRKRDTRRALLRARKAG